MTFFLISLVDSKSQILTFLFLKCNAKKWFNRGNIIIDHKSIFTNSIALTIMNFKNFLIEIQKKYYLMRTESHSFSRVHCKLIVLLFRNEARSLVITNIFERKRTKVQLRERETCTKSSNFRGVTTSNDAHKKNK